MTFHNLMCWWKGIAMVVCSFCFGFEKASDFQQIIRVVITSFDDCHITFLDVFWCLCFDKHLIPFNLLIFVQIIIKILLSFRSIAIFRCECVSPFELSRGILGIAQDKRIPCNYQINNMNTHTKLFCKELLPYFLEWLQLHVLIKCQRCNCSWVMERHFFNPPCLSIRCRRTINWALVCHFQLLTLLLGFWQRNLPTPFHL